MLKFAMTFRMFAWLIVFGWIGAGTPVAVLAADGGVAPPLPATLTRESVRDLLSQLSDAQVRSLLLDQLDRAALESANRSAATPAPTGMTAMAGMAGVVDQHAGAMRDRYAALYDAYLALPRTLRDAAARIAGPDASRLIALAAFIAAMFAAAWLAERLYAYVLRRYRARFADATAATFGARAFQLAVRLLLDLGQLAVFGIVAIVFFFSFWLDDELRRLVVLEALFVVVAVRLASRVARFLLAPSDAPRRLLPLGDTAARDLRRFAIIVALVYSGGLGTVTILRAAGGSAESADLIAIAVWFIGVSVSVLTVWRVRRPIADLIRGGRRPGAIVGWTAELWPVIATAYFVALMLGGVFNLLAGVPITDGTGLASLLLVVVLPIVDMVLCRAVAAVASGRSRAGINAVAQGPATDAAGEISFNAVPSDQPGQGFAAYEPAFRRVVHIVVAVVGLLLIARLWDLDVFALAQRSLGGRIASALLGITVVLLATYVLWEVTRTAIDHRLGAEGDHPDDVPATRLRTVLPILRATILVTIVVMAAMSILAALGVDILPLLAGAGVVGVAIGFGSQTLVRDIVSGAFFLMDDAFRLGEYIEVGDAKGRVERINLRSVFLRHHRGAINILPYGEIKRLRNTSRDWAIHVMEFRLTYDTNMLQVKKILKQIGEELAADPDYAGDVLQPLKSGGVTSAEDSAIVVRAKFTARPTSNAWVVRRVAYDKIIRAFRAAGIRFAHREVTVNAPEAQGTGAALAPAGAAALALESPTRQQGKKMTQSPV